MQSIYRYLFILFSIISAQSALGTTTSCRIDDSYTIEIYRYCTGGMCSSKSIKVTIANGQISGDRAYQLYADTRGSEPSIVGRFSATLREIAPCQFLGIQHRSAPSGLEADDHFEVKLEGTRLLYSQRSHLVNTSRDLPALVNINEKGLISLSGRQPGGGTPGPVDPIVDPVIPGDCPGEITAFGIVQTCYDRVTSGFTLAYEPEADVYLDRMIISFGLKLTPAGNLDDNYLDQRLVAGDFYDRSGDYSKEFKYQLPDYQSLAVSVRLNWCKKSEVGSDGRCERDKQVQFTKELSSAPLSLPTIKRPEGIYKKSRIRVKTARLIKFSGVKIPGWTCSPTRDVPYRCWRNIASDQVPVDILAQATDLGTIDIGVPSVQRFLHATQSEFELKISTDSYVEGEAFSDYNLNIPHSMGVLDLDGLYVVKLQKPGIYIDVKWDAAADEMISLTRISVEDSGGQMLRYELETVYSKDP